MSDTQRLDQDTDMDLFERNLADLRLALESAPEAAREEARRAFDQDQDLIQRITKIIIPEMDKRFRKRYYPIIIGAVGALLAIVLAGGWFVIDRIGETALLNAATNTDQDAAIKRSEVLIMSFQDQLKQANDALVAQGLPPILGPQDVVPGSPEQAALINASATASALEQLSRRLPEGQVTTGPAPDVARIVAEEVSRQVRAAQVMASPDQVINAVGDYIQRNGLPRGPQGDQGVQGVPGDRGPQGVPGLPPTTEEIRSAFRAEIVANPQVLCPLGGSYGSRTVTLAGGGTVMMFSCFGDDQQPQPQPGGGDPQPGGGDPQPTPNSGTGSEQATPTPTPTPAPESPQEPLPGPSADPTTSASPESSEGLLDGLLSNGMLLW